MFAIEYFVGHKRGTWVRGRRKYHNLEDIGNVIAADWQTEARHFTGVYLRRVVTI